MRLKPLHKNTDGLQPLQTVILLAVGVMVASGLRSIWDDRAGGGLQGETVGLFEQLTGETSACTAGWEAVPRGSSGSLAAWGRRSSPQETETVMDPWIEEERNGGGDRPGVTVVRAKPHKIGDVPVNQADREVAEESPKPKPRLDPPAKDDGDVLVRTDPWFPSEGDDERNPVHNALPIDRWLQPGGSFAGQRKWPSRFAQKSHDCLRLRQMLEL